MNCLICGKRVKKYFVLKEYQFIKCDTCGFINIEYVATGIMDTFYEKNYFDGNLARFSAGNFNSEIPHFKQWLIKKYLDKPKYKNILEIGPGTEGGLIKYFRFDNSKFIQCVELSNFASTHLNNNELPTFTGKVYDFEATRKFDLIIATEVIEHDPNPQLFVKAVYNLLVAGGMCFISTGNTEGLNARIASKKWYYWDPPAHVSYFNNRNIKQLFEMNCFKNVKIINSGYNWIKLLQKYHIEVLFSFLGKVPLSTGMFVFATKPETPVVDQHCKVSDRLSESIRKVYKILKTARFTTHNSSTTQATKQASID